VAGWATGGRSNIETSAHHCCKLAGTARVRYHQQSLLLRSRERCVCAEETRAADALWAFPAAVWRTAHAPRPKMDYSAAAGNDLCSPKIAVVSIIS